MWIDIFGTTLLHATWQFTVIGLALFMALQVMPAKASHGRYLASCAALVACVLAFIATLAWASRQATQSIAGGEGTGQVGPDWLTMMVVVWLIGAALSLAYNSISLLSVSRLKASAQGVVPHQMNAAFYRLGRKIGVPDSVSLMLSRDVSIPCTFGMLKPVVLLPTQLLTRLSAEEVEAILAHELAHIRRHDYLVNIIQQAILSVLYFHPAVHYISREIDRERENACDDLATSVTGRPRDLARALGKVSLFAHAPSMVMAALGRDHHVANRMARLVSPVRNGTDNLIKVVTTAVLAAGVVLIANQALAFADTSHTKLTETQRAELRDEICNQAKADGYYRRSGFARDGMVIVNLRNDAITLNGQTIPDSQLPQYIEIIDKYGLKRGKGQYIYFNSRGSEIELGVHEDGRSTSLESET